MTMGEPSYWHIGSVYTSVSSVGKPEERSSLELPLVSGSLGFCTMLPYVEAELLLLKHPLFFSASHVSEDHN